MLFPLISDGIPLGTDQLNVIFDLLGTPSEQEIAELHTEEAKQHIRALARRERKGVWGP